MAKKGKAKKGGGQEAVSVDPKEVERLVSAPLTFTSQVENTLLTAAPTLTVSERRGIQTL